jgi:hypothetical protein
MADFSEYSDSEIIEHIDMGCEYLGEMEAEVGSEVARYGDGPPGSALQIASARESLAAGLAEAQRRGLPGIHPLPFPCQEIASILRFVDYNPEPFPGAGLAPAVHVTSRAPVEDDIPF